MLNSKVTNIKNIRKEVIPYMLCWIFYYTWILVFFTWWINDFDNSYIFKSKELFTIYTLFLIIINVIIFLVHPKNFKKYYVFGGISSLIFLIFYYFINTYFNLIYILPVFMAFSFIGLLQMFIYIMNNSERFFSLLIGNFFLILLVLLQDIKVINTTNNYLFLILLLFLSILPTIKTKSERYYEEEKKFKKTAPKISKLLYLSVIINCIFLTFCRGVGRAFLLIANDMYPFNLEIYYYLGALFGCIILYALFNHVKRCNIISWNMIFALFVLSSFLYMWPSSLFVKNLFAFILGISLMMGINSMYYILGVISKKYWDFKFSRFNILVIGLLGCGFGTFLGNYIYKYGSDNFNNIILTISVIMVIVLLILSPILENTFFRDKWDEDSTKATIDNLNKRKYSKYNLTLKEMEVCNYIIENNSVRQISISMGISENTVKFHKKQIFKKLNISSKDELISLLK